MAVIATIAAGGCGTTLAPSATVVRGCSPQQGGSGYGGVNAVSQRQALHVGPLSLGVLGTLTLASLDRVRPGQTRFGAIESIAVIKAGAIVTVAVPSAERAYVALLYDSNKFRDDGAYRISDLDWVARFEACKDRHFNHGRSQFDGGIVLAGRRCFTLDFYITGYNRRIERTVPPSARCRDQRAS